MGESEEAVVKSKAHFVLVHGIGGGSWCWYKLHCLIHNSGYRVSSLDLKASGLHRSHADHVLDFDDYNAPLDAFFAALPEHEQVILVGHSAGGLSVTRASRKFSEKVGLAVYVAASMLEFGYRTDQDVKEGVPDLSEYGDVYEVAFGLGNDKPPTSAIIKKEFQRKIAYQMSPQEDSTLASILLRPGPIQAILSAKFVDDQSVDKVPRVFIKALQDRVLKPNQQDAMIKRWQPLDVYSLDTDHSPFFSNPFMLFGFLVKAASKLGY